MTEKNYTHISVVLDESGSMHTIWEDTIGSFNRFIDEQKIVSGKATLSLVKFSDYYWPVFDFLNLQDVPKLNKDTYRPSNTTALLDAIGKTISDVGNKLLLLKTEERPEKVVFVIITDGYENASIEFKKNKIKEMIEHQSSKYNWQFVFLGANMDAVNEAGQIGIFTSATYSHTPIGISSVYTAMGSGLSNYRMGKTQCMDIDINAVQ